MKCFWDTSALAKRYVLEKNSDQVAEIFDSSTEDAVSIICLPELISAFCRLSREQKLSPQHYEQLKFTVMEDIKNIEVLSIVPAIITQVINNLENSSLRAMDAIHIGSALIYQPTYFISADERQLLAAEKVGLAVKKV